MSGAFYRPSSPTVRSVRSSQASVKRVLVSVAIGLAVTGGIAGALAFLRFAPRFTVTRVVLEGVPEIRRSEAEGVTDRCIGQPLLFVDLDAPVIALSALPWVERAQARRVVPSTILIRISARPPVALARRDGELWAVDAHGTYLGPHLAKETGPSSDFVVIDPGSGPGASEAVAAGAAFVERLRKDDPFLYSRLSEVEVGQGTFAVVDREGRCRLLFGPGALEPGQAAVLWRAFLTLRPELDRHSLSRVEADLRFADRIILMAPAGDAVRGKT